MKIEWTWADEGIETKIPGKPWGEDDDIPLVVVLPEDSGATGELDVEALLSEGQKTTLTLLRDHGEGVYELLVEALEEEYARDVEPSGGGGPVGDQPGGGQPIGGPGGGEPGFGHGGTGEPGVREQPGGGHHHGDQPYGEEAMHQAPAADLFDSYEDYDEDGGAYGDSFDDRFSINEIYILPSSGPAAEWGLTASADFEPDHGLGVIFNYNEIRHIGYQDVIYRRIG